MKKKIAVICAYNNDEILNGMLEQSCIQQDVLVEKKYYKNKYPSAAETFLNAIRETDAEILCFVHQDFRFSQCNFLKLLAEEIMSEPRALYGLCGAVRENGQIHVYSNMFHGIQNVNIGEKLTGKKQVQGLDEVFVACHRSVFEEIGFDPDVMDGWHLYVQDLCMQAQEKGIPVYVLPLSSQHKSILEMPEYLQVYGLYPDVFYTYLKKLKKKHCSCLNEIICPCIAITTTEPKFSLKSGYLLLKTRWKRYLRRKSL